MDGEDNLQKHAVSFYQELFYESKSKWTCSIFTAQYIGMKFINNLIGYCYGYDEMSITIFTISTIHLHVMFM